MKVFECVEECTNPPGKPVACWGVHGAGQVVGTLPMCKLTCDPVGRPHPERENISYKCICKIGEIKTLKRR